MQKLFRSRKEILKYLVASVILAVPIYPKFPVVNIPGTFVSIRLEDFLLVIVTLFLVSIIYTQRSKFLKDKINRAIILFLAAGLVSVTSAVLITKTVETHIAILHWARRVEYLVPFFLGLYAIKLDRKNLEFFLKVLMITVVVSFIYGFGQKYFAWPIIITQNLEYSQGVALRYVQGAHINAGFAGHYDLGTFLVLVLPVLVSLFALAKRFKVRLVLFITLSSALWLLAFSGSRISVASYLVAASLSLVLVKKYKFIPFIVVLSLVFFGFSSNLRARYNSIFEVVRNQVIEAGGSMIETSWVNPINDVSAQEQNQGLPQRRIQASPTPTPIPVFEDRSTSIRLNVEWPRAIRAFSKNPLLGTGYSSITLATDNDYLRLIGEAGLLGLVTFFLVFLRIGEVIRKKFPFNRHYSKIELAFLAGTTGGVLGVFVNAVFIDVFEASKFAIIIWLFLGMSISVLRAK